MTSLAHRIAGRAAGLVLLATLPALAGAQQATLDTWGVAFAGIQLGTVDDFTDSGVGSIDLDATVSSIDALGRSATAFARTGVGSNHVLVSATNPAPSPDPMAEGAPIAFAEAISDWNVAFVISGGTGIGRLRLTATVEATVDKQGGGDGPFLSYNVSFYPLGETEFSQVPMSWNLGSVPEGSTTIAPVTLERDFSFVYDEPFALLSSMRGTVFDNGTVDASHSAHIVSTIIPQGASIAVFSAAPVVFGNLAISPVPEPAAGAMLVAGLGLLVARVRRHRARPDLPRGA